MKIRPYVLIATAALAVLATAMDETATFKATVQKQMDLYIKTLKARDTAGVEKVMKANFAPEFKDTDLSGHTRDLKEIIKAMKTNFQMLKSVESASLKIEKAKVANGKATTTEHFLMKATLANPQAPGKTAKLAVDSVWTAVYVKRNGKWLCISSKTSKEVQTIDGHRVG